MKSLKLLAPLVLAGVLSLGGCDLIYNLKQDNDAPKKNSSEYVLGNISKNVLGVNYNHPNGLSSKNLANSRSLDFVRTDGTTEIYFTEEPTYLPTGDSSFRTRPKVYQINNPNAIYEFTEEDKEDFKVIDGHLYENNTLIRSRGLNLETLILNDNSLLVISNISNKLFRIYPDGQGFRKENYLVNDELFGTTDLSLGEDGDTVSLVQVPLYKSPTSENDFFHIRNKRVISFKLSDNSKTINTEFELPDIPATDDHWMVPEKISTYAGAFFQFGDKMDVVKHSGIFYVSDVLDKKIYKIENGIVNTFKSLERPVTSMAIDERGNLFIVNGVLLNQNKEIAFHPELVEISPDGNETSIISLEQFFNYSFEGIRGENIPLQGTEYIFPQQNFSSLSISETPEKISINCADYLDGTISEVSADKIPAE